MNEKDTIIGIDVGAETTNLVILKDGKVVYSATTLIGVRSASQAAEEAVKEALAKAGIAADNVRLMVGTGAHIDEVPFVQERVTESLATCRGINWISPKAHTLIDVGASKYMALKCRDGNPVKVARNDRCATGAGVALRMAASVLSLRIEDIGPLSAKATDAVVINSTCSVFTESEIISLLHHGKKKPEDILKGVYQGMAARFYSLFVTVGIEDDVYIIGGVAKNEGVVKAIAERIKHPVLVPPDPSIVGAIGAALTYANGGSVA